MTSDPITPDTALAIAFLKLVYPEGPWVLTGIRPDRKAMDTKTFRPATEGAMEAWLEEFNGIYNIYWSVNPPLYDLNKKASREDIKEVVYLHVDIDPRAGEPPEEEQKRCLALLVENLPSTVPAPTITLFSGGGYQAFWKLEKPIPINGNLTRAEEAKRYNQQLELLFGGDNCHNIDRIMRLPGTVNIPDERKIRKGRQKKTAELISFTPENVYALDRFTCASIVQLPGLEGLSRGQATVTISGNVERLRDINELDRWGVSDRVKVVCVQGSDPDEPKEGDNSRSGWLFFAVCQLVRKEVPDDVIFSILTDPEFGISESVLEKGNNAERYAIRQIERAKEEIVDPWLRKLNERYAVILNIGGKCRVVEEVVDNALNRSRLTRLTFEDFSNAYRNHEIIVGTDRKNNPKTMPVGRWWLDHPQRRQFTTIVFAPAQEVADAYNLWQGFGFDALPGNLHESFLKHIYDNVCESNAEYYEYLLGWMARVVQRPNEPGEVAIVLRGGKGVGKSFFAKQFGKLFGRHFLEISNPLHLVGNFNSHLRDTVVLFADEAFYAGDKKQLPILKHLITSDTLMVEAKGVDPVNAANFVHVIMASNDDHVVQATQDERRFFVLNVGAERQQQIGYFQQIAKDLENGGYANLLHFLLSYDISRYEVRTVPQTHALREQKLQTAEPWVHQIVQMAESGSTPDHDAFKPEFFEIARHRYEQPSRDPGWVSAAGVLEAAGLNAQNRRLQMAAFKALDELIERDSSGRKISKHVVVRCAVQPGKPPLPVRGHAVGVPQHVRSLGRRMHKLKSLKEVRDLLSKFGADWDESVRDWQLNGDEF